MYLKLLVLSALISGVAVRADFSYEQTSKITGGAMAGMMKVAGAFSAKAREPIVSTVMVRGDRMASVTRDQIHVIDLSRETFTDIDLAHKTWSVMTFAEMENAMKQMAEKMGQRKDQASLNFRADVKETGQSRVINGLNTSEKVLTLAMEGTDAKTGQTGGMDMQMDMWIAPNMPGYEEVRDFYRRMATKINWSPMMRMAGPIAAQNQKGMSELVKEMAKLEGIPVMQITRIGMSASGMPSEADMQRAQADAAHAQQQAAQQQTTQQQSQPNLADAATRTASTGALGNKAARVGAIAGGLGGFGGFGRKKKSEETAAPAPPPATAAPQETASASVPAGSSGSGALMELTTELTRFSSSVDSSKFDVPSGFKQVQSDIRKSMQ